MKFTVLVDNKTDDFKCEAEWGLSLLVETEGKRILFDVGASDMFARNAKKLDVDLTKLDAMVVSHGHYDHTEGMPAFVSINDNCPIYLHENALREFYDIENGKAYDSIGIQWKPEFTKSIENRIVRTRDIVKLFDNVDLIGNIPHAFPDDMPEKFLVKVSGKNQSLDNEISKNDSSLDFEPDDMSHEQILVVSEGDSVYVFSGCSHNGVTSILNYVKKLYPEKNIGAFIAGMHLYDYKGQALDNILSKMDSYEVESYLPLHCTGLMPILRMKEVFGDRCIIATSGMTVEF